MSLLNSVLSFAAVAGLVTIIPGLDTAIVIRTAVRDGRRHGFAAALGVTSGTLVWGAAAAAGISALLELSSVAYTTLRLLGCAYMLWIGARLLLAAIRDRVGAAAAEDMVAGEPRGLVRSWSRGFMTNLLNPKVGAFYLAVLPQFIPPHTSQLAIGLLLAGVHDLEALIWFTAIILGTHSLGTLLARRGAQRAVDGVTGVALIGFGVRLGLSSR